MEASTRRKNIVGHWDPVGDTSTPPPSIWQDWIRTVPRHCVLSEQSPEIPEDVLLRLGAGGGSSCRWRVVREGESELDELLPCVEEELRDRLDVVGHRNGEDDE